VRGLVAVVPGEAALFNPVSVRVVLILEAEVIDHFAVATEYCLGGDGAFSP